MSYELLTESEAAHYIGMSVAYLRADRVRGTLKGRTPGPSFLRLGRTIRYEKADLDQWIEQCRVKRGPRATRAA
jgi:predicted DNA-binding transcriptional regulator AlpA